MIEIKHKLRKAYIDKLISLSYLGQSIPVNASKLTSPPAILPIGNSTGAQAYVLIQNQTVNDASPKCSINQDTSLQLDIVTVFNANAGSALHAELITQEIFDLLFPDGGKDLDIQTDGLEVWRGWLEGSRDIEQENADTTVYRNVLIFNHSVTQGNNSTT